METNSSKFKPNPQVEQALWDLAIYFHGQEVPEKERSALLHDRTLMDRLAARLSEVAGRSQPWGGLYPVNVLTHKIGASRVFAKAVLTLVATVENIAIPDAYQGTEAVQVFALPGRVEPGTLILGRSQLCARPACRVNFIPRSGNQRYHSPECRLQHARELREKDGGSHSARRFAK